MRKFYKVKGYEDKEIVMPKRATLSSAGYDIASNGNYTIKPGQVVLINTGLKVQMPSDEVLKVYARSSLASKKGLFLTNSVGIIDSDYFENENNDGHIKISVYNYTSEVVEVYDKEKIAQGIFVRYEITADDEVSAVRNGGFGSTTK